MQSVDQLSAHVVRECEIRVSARVQQLQGMFDIPPSPKSREEWDVILPLNEQPWHIGLIVGPSGAGKSTVARELFGERVVSGFCWDPTAAVVDGFPKEMSIKNVVLLLNSVGFSSPPYWLRPFHVLSTGQQFRVTLARVLVQASDLSVMDEFTSVVDRTVAQIGSAAVAKTVRRRGQQFVAVTCHYDVMDWLQPDWVYEPHLRRFQWRCLQRHPTIELSIYRVHHSVWEGFKGHHYLTGDLNRASRCYAGLIRNSPVCFMAILRQPVRTRQVVWRGHRTVVLPDFQGIGIGNRFIEEIARLYLEEGARYVATTAHPAINHYRSKSPLWRCTRTPSPTVRRQGPATLPGMRRCKHSTGRMTASWEFVGP